MNDRYKLLEKIAEGGRAVVWRVKDQSSGHGVALKRLSAAVTSVEIQREIEALKAVQNPNIVALLDAATDEQGGFLVMELLDGATLESCAPLTLPEFETLARQLLSALEKVHRAGWLHRDVKPENLMQTGNGDWKLIDFGLACRADEKIDNALTGSVHFMAPEQYEKATMDVRADVYALGCVFYFALTGRAPFEGETTPQVITAHLYQRPQPLGELRPDVPVKLAKVIEQMMARHPDERPAIVADIQARFGFDRGDSLLVDTLRATA